MPASSLLSEWVGWSRTNPSGNPEHESFISKLKFRGTYGLVGNDEVEATGSSICLRWLLVAVADSPQLAILGKDGQAHG